MDVERSAESSNAGFKASLEHDWSSTSMLNTTVVNAALILCGLDRSIKLARHTEVWAMGQACT